MSLAQSPVRRRLGTTGSTAGVGVILGELLGALPRPELSMSELRVRELPTAAARARHAATVATLMRGGPPLGDPQLGETVRRRIVRVLDQFRQQGTVTLPPGRKTWERLHILAKLCAVGSDWASATGPIVGASNAVLEVQLGTTNVRRDLREMARWGLIVPFCPKGNGHRFYVPAKKGKTAAGAGWSLAPLVLMLEHLEETAREETRLRELRVALPSEIKAHLNAMRSVLKPFAERHAWAKVLGQAVLELAERRRNANRGSLETLRAILVDAEQLRQRVEDAAVSHATDPGRGMKASTRPDSCVHHQYNGNLTSNCRNGSAGARRTSEAQKQPRRSPPKAPMARTHALREDDRFGIKRSGFGWSEAEQLFPFIGGFLALPPRATIQDCHAVAPLIGVHPATVGRAIAQIGIEATLICLLITGQHSHDMEIERTPEIYMRGLMRRAREGDLNIGHTLFGRRGRAKEPDDERDA